MTQLDADLRWLPVEESSPPARFDTESSVLELKRTGVFSRTWQLAVHGGGLQSPGDQVVGEIAGTPATNLCSGEGELRAFRNLVRDAFRDH